MILAGLHLNLNWNLDILASFTMSPLPSLVTMFSLCPRYARYSQLWNFCMMQIHRWSRPIFKQPRSFESKISCFWGIIWLSICHLTKHGANVTLIIGEDKKFTNLRVVFLLRLEPFFFSSIQCRAVLNAINSVSGCFVCYSSSTFDFNEGNKRTKDFFSK